MGPRAAQRFLVAALVAGALVAGAVVSRRADAAPAIQKITLYSVATKEQFVDNGDDEARGYANNPFKLRNKALQAAETEDNNGPFPGDEAFFGFDVFTNSGLSKRDGTADYTCQYYFDRNAFCDASYNLDGGTLFGAGAFSFDATRFAIAITGGTGKYANVTGDVEAMPGSNHSQRLAFVLQPN